LPEAGLEPAQCQAPPDFESDSNHYTNFVNINQSKVCIGKIAKFRRIIFDLFYPISLKSTSQLVHNHNLRNQFFGKQIREETLKRQTERPAQSRSLPPAPGPEPLTAEATGAQGGKSSQGSLFMGNR